MATRKGDVHVEITGDASDLQRAARTAQRSVGGLRGAAVSMGKGFLGATPVIAAAGAQVLIMGKAMAVAGQAVLGVMEASRQAVVELEKFKGTGLGLSDNDVTRVTDAHNAMDMMKASAYRMSVTFTASMKPALQAAAAATVLVADAFQELFDRTEGARQAVFRFYGFMTGALLGEKGMNALHRAFKQARDDMNRFEEATETATEATGRQVEAVAALVEVSKSAAKLGDPGLSAEKKRILAAEQLVTIEEDKQEVMAETMNLEAEGFDLASTAAALGIKNARASAVAQTAVAVARALAGAPFPANLINAATVGALGAAQIASIQPASFDIGGIVQGGPQMPGGRPGQRLAQVEDGEMILTRNQQARMGGGGGGDVRVYVGNREIKRTIVRSGATSGLQKRRGIGQRRFSGA